jgi:hypothetical protein
MPEPAPVLTKAEQRKQVRLARKQERYDQVRTLHAEGLSAREIGRQLQMSFYTVRKYLHAARCPVYPAAVKRGVSKLDHFLDYLTERWLAGCHNASQLWREIAQQGFTGSRGLVAKWAVAQRQVLSAQPPQHQLASPLSTPAKQVTPWRAGRTAWLLVKPETLLDEAEQQALLRIKQADAAVAQAHQLVHAFQQMMRERKPDHLLSWIQEVVDSGLDALTSFANGIRQDFEAVKNALALPWSNGQTEGQVNRLKLIKRQMYVEPPLTSCAAAYLLTRFAYDPFTQSAGEPRSISIPPSTTSVSASSMATPRSTPGISATSAIRPWRRWKRSADGSPAAPSQLKR